MSEAVRAAIAARRAEVARSRSASPVKQRQDSGTPDLSDSSSFIQPFGSPKKKTLDSSFLPRNSSSSSISLAQKSEQDLLFASCSSGKLNLSSRLPALTSLPPSLFTLLDGETPRWFEDKNEELDELDETQETKQWYEREDLRILSVANGELSDVSERLGDFRGLVKLELQNNRLTRIPDSAFQLVNLTTLNLSRNSLTSVPSTLLALDSLIQLDLSHNKLQSLWDDARVKEAREDRREWDEENADEEGGIWAGFLERAGSPTKRLRPPPPSRVEEAVQPMRSLRILRLAGNRLGNAGVFDSKLTWPPNLVELDLSDNCLRGPVSLSALGYLKELKVLSLGGNGIADDVFKNDIEEGASGNLFGPRKVFQSLQVLDLQRCEIDDLAPLERVFASKTTTAVGAQYKNGNDDDSTTQSPVPGLARRQLVRIRLVHDAPTEEQQDTSSPAPLYIVLEGNHLRCCRPVGRGTRGTRQW